MQKWISLTFLYLIMLNWTLKIILCQPNEVAFKVKMLLLYCLYHTGSPDGQRLGRHIHSKRRIWRFGFDDSWTSQTHLSVKNKATRNVSWVYCIQPLLASVAFRIRCQERVFIYLHIRGAFGVVSALYIERLYFLFVTYLIISRYRKIQT